MDLFDEKSIDPMLIAENQPPFDKAGYIYELKLDGIRCLAYLDGKTAVLRNKRNKDVSDIYPELSGVGGQVSERVILDGEVVVIKDGVPDFFELQRRSLMANPFKIKLRAERYPVCFTAFDILYRDGVPLLDRPLMERKAALYDAVRETPLLALSRHIESGGVALFDLAKKQGLEGTVAKKSDSLYHPGKRTRDWIKCKALLDDDFVVCGYDVSDDKAGVVLGEYMGGRLVYRGHVSFGVGRNDYRVISAVEVVDKALVYPDFADMDGVRWIAPELVCTVRYMERTPSGGLRQPVYKGLRNDKTARECVASVED